MWRPPKNQPVSNKEFIGRRLIGSDYLLKKNSSKGKIGDFNIDVFIETRTGADLSVDRIGMNAPDSDVLRTLLTDCTEHARKAGKSFAGWASISVSNIRNKPLQLEVMASPIAGQNEYHADVQTAKFTVRERNLAAFALAHLSGFVGPEKPTWWQSFLSWLKSQFNIVS